MPSSLCGNAAIDHFTRFPRNRSPPFVTSELVASWCILLSLTHEILAAVVNALLRLSDLRDTMHGIRGFASARDCLWQMDDREVDGRAGAEECSGS